MSAPDAPLRNLAFAIVAEDMTSWRAQLQSRPDLARARFATGATRNSEEGHFLDPIRRWIYAGDTALHIAAAGYRLDAAKALLGTGAEVQARNRHGQRPLHYAASGGPGSPHWNPPAQTATIACLIQSGADPNAPDKHGVTPLHIAVRTRCAEAVRTLVECGANPSLPNGSGSTPLLLATRSTGRGGSGSPEAKAEQQRIIDLLERALLQST